MEPTARALELRATVQVILDAACSFDAPRDSFDPERSERSFSFFITDGGISRLLPPLIRVLSKEAPSIRLRAVQLNAQHLQARLETGEVDLAFGAFSSLTHGVRRQRLFSEGFVSLTQKNHPRINGAPSRAAFIAERHVLIAASGTGHAHHLAERALEAVVPAKNILLSVPSFIAAALVVKHTDAIATLPERLGRLLAEELGLQVVAPPVELPRIMMAQYWHERFHRDAGNRWLRSVVFRLFNEG